MESIRFFKGLSWLIILNLLVKPVWLFFIDRQVQIVVGYEEYGKYFAILNLSYVLFFLSDMGISNMLNQRVANHLAVNVVQLLRVKAFLLLAYFVVFCLIGWLTHISHWEILFLVIIIQVFTSLLIFCRSIVTANQYFSIDAGLSVIDKMLMIIFCGSILYTSVFGKLSLILFLQIQMACTAIAVLVSFLLILRRKMITAEGTEHIETIIKRVLPFGLIILLMSVHYRLDGFLLERIHAKGALEAGIYASAYRLLDAGNMVGYLASAFLVAFVARNLTEKQILEDVVFNTRHLLLFCSLGVVAFVFVFAPWLETMLYHSNSSYNALVIKLCMASYPAYCLVHVYGSILTGAAKFWQFISTLILSVVLNIILNSILIPGYGAVGCCIAALVSQYFCGMATLTIATRAVKISFHGKSLLVYVLFATLLTVFFYFGKNTFVNVWLILAIAVFVGLLFLFTQLSVFKKYLISVR